MKNITRIAAIALTLSPLVAATAISASPAFARQSPYGKGDPLHGTSKEQIAHKRAHKKPTALISRSSWS